MLILIPGLDDAFIFFFENQMLGFTSYVTLRLQNAADLKIVVRIAYESASKTSYKYKGSHAEFDSREEGTMI